MAKILVIKLSALGDFVLAMSAFKAIRGHHREDEITLLTTSPFAELAHESGYFDRVWIDKRPRFSQIRTWLSLRRQLCKAGFARVYDLQGNDRSSFYFHLFGLRRPEWSGIARGCSHPHRHPARTRMHSFERHSDQLASFGIVVEPKIDLTQFRSDVARFGLSDPYALLVPGCAPHRPEKRWPGDSYSEIAFRLLDDGILPVLIGGPSEKEVLAQIAADCSGAIDLCGQTRFAEIVELARNAAVAIGNDTGPMHLIAAADCPSLVLYSQASVPEMTMPRGALVRVLQTEMLHRLHVETVGFEVDALLQRSSATEPGSALNST